MFELIAASAFTAFFIAVLDQLVDLKIFKALASLLFSSGALALLGVNDIKLFLVLAVASAFLALFLTVAADRLTFFKPVQTRPIRPE